MKLLLFGFLAVLLVWSSMAMPIDESVDEEVEDALDARDVDLTAEDVMEDCELKCAGFDDIDLLKCAEKCVLGDAVEMAGSKTRNIGTPEKRKINWKNVWAKVAEWAIKIGSAILG